MSYRFQTVYFLTLQNYLQALGEQLRIKALFPEGEDSFHDAGQCAWIGEPLLPRRENFIATETAKPSGWRPSQRVLRSAK
jgi:hypothetical protein